MTKKSTLKGFSPVRKFKNDDDAISNGVWREIEDGAAKLLIARWNNPAHQAYMRAQHELHGKVLEKDDDVSAKKWEEITNFALANHILKGWDGIVDEYGDALPFSAETALQLIADLPEFGNLVFQLSSEVEQYRAFKVADAVKN